LISRVHGSHRRTAGFTHRLDPHRGPAPPCRIKRLPMKINRLAQNAAAFARK